MLDQTVFSAYLNSVYCALLELMKRSDPREAWARIRRSLMPSLYASWKFWPFVHLVTFSVMPMHLRVLWVDVVEIVWVSILSICINTSEEGCQLQREDMHTHVVQPAVSSSQRRETAEAATDE